MHLVEIIEQLNKDIVTYEVALHISKRDHNKITAKAIQQNIDALTGIRNQLNALI